MPNAPYNPSIFLAQQAIAPIVLLGAGDGSPPVVPDPNASPAVAGDATDKLRVRQLYCSAGGKKLDYCKLEYDLAGQGETVINYGLLSKIARQIAILLPAAAGSQQQTPLFWGELSKENPVVGPAGTEKITLTARIENYHFGDTCQGMNVWNPLANDGAGETVTVNRDPVWQPLIDGVQLSNMSQKQDPDTDAQLWIDPESVITFESQAYQTVDAADWDLTNAVFSVCAFLNGDEPFVNNPTLAALQAAIVTPPNLFDLKLRRGAYLPFYLDGLLRPLGFDWYRKVGFDDGFCVPTITVFSRVAGGLIKQLYLQMPGSQLTATGTNVQELDLDVSIADLANVVRGEGSLEEVEVTVPLYRGWPQTASDGKGGTVNLDGLSSSDLWKENTASAYWNVDCGQAAWRLFVMNEAGDFNNTRPEITAAPDLTSVFSIYVPKRRKFLDCLTYDVNSPLDDQTVPQKRRRPFLEWVNVLEATTSAAITGVTAGNPGQFVIAGLRLTAIFAPGSQIIVSGSNGNDGTYTVVSSAAAAANTAVTVQQRIPNANVSGTLSWATWAPVPSEWGFQILQEMCGIRFTGAIPPEQLTQAGAGARLRITATIRGDACLTATAVRDPASPNARDVEMYLDMGDRFHKRKKITEGPLASQLTGNKAPNGADERDDTQKLTTFVNQIRNVEDVALIAASVTLFGIHLEYQIGDFIDKVDGRNISFNCKGGNASTKRYLQITGILWDWDEQTTKLEFDPEYRQTLEERIRKLPVSY